MAPENDVERIREACTSLGQLEAFAIDAPPRIILVACMEIGACYVVNLWCEALGPASDVEAFLTTRGIISHRARENDCGRISVGYTVSEVLEAAYTVAEVAIILKIPAKPKHAQHLIQSIHRGDSNREMPA